MTEPSELLHLWTESDGSPWKVAIGRLRSTLTTQPPENQPA